MQPRPTSVEPLLKRCKGYTCFRYCFAILLRCSRRDVAIARMLALTRLANHDAACAQADECRQGLTKSLGLKQSLSKV
jgi:hypothetical protein